MTTFEMLQAKRLERKKIADAAGALLQKVHGRTGAEKRSMSAEETTEWEKRMTDVDALKVEIDQLERQTNVETTLAQPAADQRSAGREDTKQGDAPPAAGATNTMSDADRKKFEKRALTNWMRGGMAALAPDEQRMLDERNRDLPPEIRALSATTGASGAYTVPVGYPYALEIALRSYGGILAVADYIDTDNGYDLPYPTMNDTANTGETIAENTAVAGATGGAGAQEPTFGIVTFHAYMSDSGVVLLPIQLIQDSAFDPETWMNDALKTRLGRRMNNLATVGDGVNKPTGVLTAATAGKTFASPTAITYPELLDLEHSVDPAYRYTNGKAQAQFMFADSTLKALKKLVDGAGRPLFLAGGTTQGISERAPDTIDGFPFTVNQDMAAIGAGNKPVLFGDFSKFKIRRVKQIQFVRFAERYMDKLQIGFLAFQRWDSNLVDAGTHPVAYAQHPTS